MVPFFPRAAFMAAILAAMLLQGCSQLPSLDDRNPSVSIQNTADTRLGKAVAPLVQLHPGTSGIAALRDGHDAFAARSLLADAAERTLDVQYYIWHNDMSGAMLFNALRRAADRGVRVRLLLDDNNTSGLDIVLASLDAHPNIEVRLFNPFTTRRWRVLGYLTDFSRLNRRMHNKSFTADNQATIIGGRNIGDEYFGAGPDVLFVDLDVLAIGPVVNDVSADFDRYWASDSAYPADRVLPAVSPATVAAQEAAGLLAARNPAALDYVEALRESPFVRDLLARRLAFEWAATHMVSDDPAKGLGHATDDELMWSRLKRIMKTPTREVQLVSPYFVPTAAGADYFSGLARQGLKVQVLTNSLEATDVAAVHSGYAKWRKPMLDAGVSLFELKRGYSGPPVQRQGLKGVMGSSGSSLHAKTFAVDRSRVFIGSFNFDPRSARLNTELGFVIDSPTMAGAMADVFATHMPGRVYKVGLSDDGGLQWVEQEEAGQRVYDQEPGTSVWLRLGVSVMSLLPIDWLL